MLEPEAKDLSLIYHPPDEALRRGVQMALDDIRGAGRGTAAAVELRLRKRYPALRIIVSKPHGSPDTDQTTWVVLRDGRGRAGHPRQRPELREVRPVVLVADDEPLVVLLISAVLVARGWRVIQATGGASALAQAEGVDLDLLITESDMRDIDGQTLASRLDRRDSRLPVLVVSDDPKAFDAPRGTQRGFLAKPFTIGDLALQVETLTGYSTGWTGCGQSAGL
jgi:CheY-like chemotaxis protein